MNCFIIAEAGVNHNGDADTALKLVDVAAECGADAVKFQTFVAERLVRPGADKAEYQRETTGSGDQFSMLKALELSPDMYRHLFVRCEERGIEFMSTPFDEEAALFLKELGMKRFKIPSGEITNLPFLAALARLDMPLILSTGMADLAEIQIAIAHLVATRRETGLPEPIEGWLTVLHCTSNYPAKFSDLNLRALPTIAVATNVPVGYSDHSSGIAVAGAAVALGATVLEKHFTLDRDMPGPDHRASLEPHELKAMVEQVRAVEAALGSAEKRPSNSELPVRDLVRRSVTLVRDVKAGERFAVEDLTLLRPGNGIQPAHLAAVRGRSAARDLSAGSTLEWSDIT